MGHATFLLLLLVVLPPAVLSRVVQVPGNSNASLEYYLCEGNAESNLTLALTSDQFVSQGPFCLTQNVTDLVITSYGAIQYIVRCRNDTDGGEGVRGFGFFNVTNLQITNIIFQGCGGTISEAAVSYVNDTQSLYFGPGQRAAFLFNHCMDLKLENMSVIGYQGFGIVGANLGGSPDLVDVSVAFSRRVLTCNTFPESGGGIYLFYQDSDIVSDQNHSLSAIINRNYSEGNYNCAPHSVIELLHQRATSIPVVGANGLTIVFSQRSYSVRTNIWCQFTDGGGTQTGTTMVLFSNDIAASRSEVVFDYLSFNNNSAQMLIHGLELAVLFYSSESPNRNTIPSSCPVIIRSASFRNYQGVLPRSNTVPASIFGILLFSQNATTYFVDISNVTFVGNRLLATTEMILLHSQSIQEEEYQNAELQLMIHNLSAYCNVNTTLNSSDSCVHSPFTNVYSRAVLFSFVNLARVTIDGTAHFSRNAAGSILYSYSTDLYLTGSMSFADGSAVYGAAIRLQGDSHIFLEEPFHAVFSTNQATQGGAIYSLNAGDDLCVFQFIPQGVYNDFTLMDIALNFTNNSAVIVGNSIYAGPIYDCDQVYSQRLNVRQEDYGLLYQHVFHFKDDNRQTSTGIRELSSFPVQACMCSPNGEISECLNDDTEIQLKETYPGRRLPFYIAVNDAFNNSVYCTIIATISTNPGVVGSPPVRWRLAEAEVIVQLQRNNCSTNPLNYTLFNLTAFEGILAEERIINIELVIQPDVVGVTLAELHVLDCPPGFVVTQQSICNCISLLVSLQITCDIDTSLVSRPPGSWIGIVGHGSDNTSIVGFSSPCPPDYCNPTLTQVNISDADMICSGQRTGILCSQCQSDLSIAFGSNSCQKCSNAWLSTIILYIAAGIILVALLFTLKLTVAIGMINGLIFYANVAGLNAGSFFDDVYLRFFEVFISFLNLELGFPLCFSSGMKTVLKTGLQFMFPIYLWAIVLLLIFVSRRSVKVANLISRNSVQVLATLFYLSYSKLLRTVIYIMTSNTIERGDSGRVLSPIIVWYYDGSVEFGSGGHVVLLLLALLTIVFLLLPYPILLTGASFFMKYRLVNRFKPLIDAYHGPYKDKWRFWFGVRLWVLLLMFSIQAGLGGSNVPLVFLLHLIVLGVFVIIQASIKPFRNFFVGLLDLFFMVNYSILAASGTYFLLQQETTSLQIVAGILLTLVFLAFIGIAVYRPVRKLKDKWKQQQELVSSIKKEANQAAPPQDQRRGSPAFELPDTDYELVTDEATDQVIIRAIRPTNQGEEMYDSNRFRDSVLETLDN